MKMVCPEKFSRVSVPIIERPIFPLYNKHIIVFITSEIRENCRLLDNSVLNVFHKV